LTRSVGPKIEKFISLQFETPSRIQVFLKPEKLVFLSQKNWKEMGGLSQETGSE
jgi:hypothetical protein